MTVYDNEPTPALWTAQEKALNDLRRQVREAAARRAAVEAVRGKRPTEIPNLFRNPAASR